MKIRIYFPINPPENKNQLFYSFTRELSDLWEKSKGFLDKKEKRTQNDIEYNFKNFCQNQMKYLRNWTSHHQLSEELSEKELAFYSMIAMRALLNLDLKTIHRYEKILLSLFYEDQCELNSEEIKKNLAKSYYVLRNVFAKNDNPSRSEFNEVLKDVWKQKKFAKKHSKKYFYQNFWHGIFPAQLCVNNPDSKDSVQMFVNFDYQDLKKFPFLNELAKSIYSEAFDNLK